MKNWFTEHPHSVNETYWQHMRFSFISAMRLLKAGIAAIIHAVFPFLCVYTASKLVAKMTGDYCRNERRSGFLTKVNTHLPHHEECCIQHRKKDEAC